jgi:hypothetical protein
MVLKYDINIDYDIIQKDIRKITNQIYKLLPSREENLDWERPLETIMVELAGMNRLFIGQQNIFFPLLCKLEGLFTLTKEDDFLLFRRTIFECLSLIGILLKECQE